MSIDAYVSHSPRIQIINQPACQSVSKASKQVITQPAQSPNFFTIYRPISGLLSLATFKKQTLLSLKDTLQVTLVFLTRSMVSDGTKRTRLLVSSSNLLEWVLTYILLAYIHLRCISSHSAYKYSLN